MEKVTLNKKQYLPYILCNMLSAAASLATAYLIGFLIDDILYTKDMGRLLTWLLVTLTVALVSAFLNFYITTYVTVYKFSVKQSCIASFKSLKNILNMNFKTYQKREKSFYYNAVTNSSFTYADMHVQLYLQVVSQIMMAIVILVFIVIVSPRLLIAFIIFVPIMIAVTYLQSRELGRLQKEAMEKQDRFLSDLKDIIEYKREINILKQNDYFARRYQSSISQWEKFMLRFRFFGALVSSIPLSVSKIYSILFMAFGGYLIIKGNLTVGILVSGVQYLDILSTPVSNICEILIRKKANKEHFERVEMLSTDIPDTGYEKLQTSKEHVFDGADFRLYRDGNKENLLYSGTSIKIDKNAFVVIKGENGTGKSLLLNLISGNLDSSFIDGDVQIGANLNKLSFLTYPHVFVNGTFMDNMFDIPVSEDIKQLLRIDFDTREIATNPLNLSLGQQQKLGLLRVLSQESEHLFLDEPFSNLDVQTQENLVGYLRDLKGKKTIVLIMHDPTFDQMADVIYQIEDQKMERKEI